MDDFKYFKYAYDFDERLEAVMESHDVAVAEKTPSESLQEKQSGFQDYLNKMSAREQIRATVSSKAKVASAQEHIATEQIKALVDSRESTITDFLEAAKLAAL